MAEILARAQHIPLELVLLQEREEAPQICGGGHMCRELQCSELVFGMTTPR